MLIERGYMFRKSAIIFRNSILTLPQEIIKIKSRMLHYKSEQATAIGLGCQQLPQLKRIIKANIFI